MPSRIATSSYRKTVIYVTKPLPLVIMRSWVYSGREEFGIRDAPKGGKRVTRHRHIAGSTHPPWVYCPLLEAVVRPA